MDTISRLQTLREKGLVENAFLNIQKWLEDDEYVEFKSDILDLIEKEDIDELNDAFYKVIPFGTGGRRGKMGVGTNRINARTIAESAQGFSDYLIDYFGINQAKIRGVVVTYDIRHNSEKFAKIAASVFAANNIKVYFYEGVRSTPQLSFSIRYKNAVGGAMISASHNPPTDNGIKVFWETGGQVVPPHDANIIEKVSRVRHIERLDFEEAKEKGIIEMLDDSVDTSYHETVGKLSLGDYRDIDIVFTPLHGCATTSFLPVLKRVGFGSIFEVEEQMSIDPDFSHVAKQIPNPEVPISLELATDYARKKKADIVLSADPDADRIGVVSRDRLDSDNYIFLNGNQIGVLIFDYITKRLKDIHEDLYGDYARDKDGAVAALLICEYAALLKQEGRTLFEQLEYIKKEYGYYRELLQAVFFYGMDGMDKMLKIMDVLRKNLTKQCCGLRVETVLDQLTKKVIDPRTGLIVGTYEGFSDNALVFYLNTEKTIRVVVRPSGTEPKIKFYAAVGREVGVDKSWDEYAKVKKEVDELVHKILEEFVVLAEGMSSGGERFEVLG